MDREAFRDRFKAYKEGKPISEIYDAGLPKYAGGKNEEKKSRFSESLGGKYQHVIDNTIDYLHSQGVDPMLIAGILGNMAQESGFNPDSIGPGGFAGTVQMSSDMANEIKRAYGKVDYKTTNRFIHDAMSGNKIISQPWRNYMKQHGGYYGRTFNSAGDAAMAFGRVFERPNEKYANWASRMLSAEHALDYINQRIGTPSEQIPVTQTTAAEYNAAHQFQPWSNYHQPDYSLNNPAPTMISSMNNPDSPAFTTPELQSRRSYNNIKDVAFDIMNGKDVEDALMDNLSKNVFGGRKIGFKNGKLPEFQDGTKGWIRTNGNDIKFDEETGELVDQVTGERGTLMLPEINITRANPDNYRSSYDPNAVINGFNALTLGGLNNLDPTQWARRAYDLPKTLFGPMKFSTYMNRWINGNEGVVSNQFSSQHPYYSAIINMLAGGAGVQSGRIINQLKPSNLGKHFYYNVNPQGYDNIIKQSKDIAKTILKGSEPDIENPRWDVPGAFAEGANSYGIPEDVFRRARIDAWRIHTNLPQKYNTFVPHKNIPGVYTSKNDINRIMDLDIIEDPNFLKMLREKEGVGIDVFNGSGGNVGFKNVKLGKTIEGDDLGVLITDDVWDIQPFSRIDYGGGLGSRITERTTNKILKKILPLQQKISKKLDNSSYIDDVDGFKKWAAEHPYEAEYIDPRDVFSKKRKIKPVLDAVNTVLHKSTTKLSDFDRWLRKTLNDKGRNFEVGSLYKGSPFRVINEFPYTKATNWNMLKHPNRDDWYSYWGGFTTKNVLPTDAWNYTHKGILPMDDSKYIIPAQIPFK